MAVGQRRPDPRVRRHRRARAGRTVRGGPRGPRDPPAPRPRRARAPVAGRAPRPRTSLPGGARGRQLHQQPPGAAVVARRPRARRRATWSPCSTVPHRDPHGCRRRGQDPAGPAGRRPTCCRSSPTSGSSSCAGVADPDDVADLIARTVGAAVVDRPAGGDRSPDARPADAPRPRQLRARRRAGCGDRRRAHGPLPAPVGPRDQPGDARRRGRTGRRGRDRWSRTGRRWSSSGSGRRPPVPTSAAVSESSMAELCRRLDGLPLAIELAAAWTATLGLPAILDGLDDRLDILRAGRAPGRRPPRHDAGDDRVVLPAPRGR